MKDEICINTFAVGNEVDTVNNGQVKSLSLPSFFFVSSSFDQESDFRLSNHFLAPLTDRNLESKHLFCVSISSPTVFK